MKKIVIFLAFFISAESFAQNPNQNNNQVRPAGNAKVAQGAPNNNQVNPVGNAKVAQGAPNNNQVNPAGNAKVAQGAPKSDYRPPALTPEEKIQIEKNTAEQKEFDGILKSLTPEQNKKFQKGNQDFGFKMMEYTKKLDDEIVKISKLKNLIAINTYILKGVQSSDPKRPAPKEMQEFYQKQISAYQKLSPEQKTLVKKELIKFRKNINALEKKRRQEFKTLFKKDLSFFKERETEKEIEDDNKF